MIDFFKNKNIQRLLLLAVLLRIMVMPFYFHPDIKTYNFQASFLKKGVGNIYTYLVDNRQSLPSKEEFVYFPLAYYFLGGYQIIVSPFLGANFNEWLSDVSGSAPISVGTFRYLFILKLPLLFFDILLAFILTSFFKKVENKRKAFVYWLFNPFTIILIYFFSNIDIIPVTIVMLSLIVAKKGKLLESGILIGLASGFKTYPMLFLPLLLISTGNLRKAIFTFLGTIITFLVIIFPFWSTDFYTQTFASGLTTRIFASGISLGFGESIMPSVVLLVMLYLIASFKPKIEKIQKYYLGVLLLLFSFIHIHIQWLLWFYPFALILFIKQKKLRLLTLILVSTGFFIPFLYDDKSMTVALIKTYSLWYDLLPTPFAFVQKIYDPYALQSILHSIFAAISIVILYKLFKKSEL